MQLLKNNINDMVGKNQLWILHKYKLSFLSFYTSKGSISKVVIRTPITFVAPLWAVKKPKNLKREKCRETKNHSEDTKCRESLENFKLVNLSCLQLFVHSTQGTPKPKLIST